MYQVQRTQSNNQTGKSLTLVNREAVEGLKVPGFDHQTTPFIERSLMANRNSIVRIIPGVADDGTSPDEPASDDALSSGCPCSRTQRGRTSQARKPAPC